MALFSALSHIPLVRGFGKRMYAAGLFGEASGLHVRRKYSSAVNAYRKALNYAQGMEEDPAIGFCIGEAYKALGEMYENGLGVEQDQLIAEECYLRAGGRGHVDYEHSVTTKSWYDKNWK